VPRMRRPVRVSLKESKYCKCPACGHTAATALQEDRAWARVRGIGTHATQAAAVRQSAGRYTGDHNSSEP
jgi:hypothetical protein